MNKSLKMLPFLLVLFFSSANSSAQSSKHDGPFYVIKDPNLVFYLDSQNIPSTLSIEYVEDVLVSSLEEFNVIEDTTLNLSYGGVIDGACENVYTPEGPPDVPRDPDRDMFCFSEDFGSLAVGGTSRTYSDGVIHERSFCSGQVILATSLWLIQYFCSDSFGDNPPLC